MRLYALKGRGVGQTPWRRLDTDRESAFGGNQSHSWTAQTALTIPLFPLMLVRFLGLDRLTSSLGNINLAKGIACIVGPLIAAVRSEREASAYHLTPPQGGRLSLTGQSIGRFSSCHVASAHTQTPTSLGFVQCFWQ
ncbi:unnamed protein product [Protopolystoma xenopodis]|uniref:Uncharacterized protein n=1 Tax=Protopolystoma xenopodis TaxID=117903 RepID=A0A3S5CFH5_9PLAT|nr:unnamed protein product [Protopolystoma xenopodis]